VNKIMTELDVIEAHKHSIRHREEIEASEKCGCFDCLAIFIPHDIIDWVDKGQTALCPHCGIDSVIGSKSGYPIDRSFLDQMRHHWF